MLSRTFAACFTKRCLTSYVHGASSTPLLYETLGGRLRSAVESVPDREFVIFDHQNIRKTYSQLYADARLLACALLELGLEPGDCLGIWGPNYYEWVTCQFATAMAGFIQVNINPAYQVEELRFALEKVGVRAVITPKKFKHSEYYRSLAEVVPAIANQKPGIGHVKTRDLPELEHIIVFGEEEKLRGAWRYEELLSGVGSNGQSRLEDLERLVNVDSPCCIQYTSGTTGYPKAATLTHHNLLNNSYLQGVRSRYNEGRHIICIPNPLYHCFGSTMGVVNAMSHQQTCAFPDAWFNPLRTLEVIEKEKCTSLYGTPTMFIDVLKNLPRLPNLDLGSLKAGYMAGSPCPVALCDRLLKELHLSDLMICYGSTELSPVVTMSYLAHEPMERIKNVGYVMDHCELLVVDEQNMPVERGVKGELLARGYMTMRGYYNDEERTKKEITPDRWYHTGDTASMNEDGSINIVGRIKDMIIRGGENIYPTEIEQFLFKIPGVADAQVIGVPDERYGEEVCAWIRLREGNTSLTPQAIREACKGKIAHYKIPKYIMFKAEHEFPLTATGKVKKHELRTISKRELGLEQVQSHFNQV